MGQYRNLGLLLLRLGVGGIFVFLHGYGKITGGPEKWTGVGKIAMEAIGINFYPVIFGFLAAASEFFGGMALILGFFTRLAAFFMFMTMTVAIAMHILTGDGLHVASHAMLAATLFLGLLFIGPGDYSLDASVRRKFLN